MSLAMTRTEREAFLADLHVGVLAVAAGDEAPLAVPIWYDYEPGGELRFVTDRSSRKAPLLERARRLRMCVQTEAPPYRYVSIEGPIVVIERANLERDVRPLAHRYLGPELGDRYVEEIRPGWTDDGSILVRMRPERWLSADYAKQYGSI